MCDVIGQPQRRCPTSSTEIVGQIIDQSESLPAEGHHSNIVALCTLEGKIPIVITVQPRLSEPRLSEPRLSELYCLAKYRVKVQNVKHVFDVHMRSRVPCGWLTV